MKLSQTKSSEFRILPAIDLLNGQSVRLQKGNLETASVVHSNPVVQAIEYEKKGASWIHIVNLDAAFGHNAKKSKQVISEVISQTKLNVQLGGGLRSEQTIEEAFALGIKKIILGTWLWSEVAHNKNIIKNLQQYSSGLVAGVDIFDTGEIAIKGWQEQSKFNVFKQDNLLFSPKSILAELKISEALCTQISKDGMLAGIDIQFLEKVSECLSVPVLVSGGVKNNNDVILAKNSSAVSGIILGKALTAGSLKLEEVF
jgi:phosphoribosylformimino-5-aminoimidazole carboxamide ribotide isomerase